MNVVAKSFYVRLVTRLAELVSLDKFRAGEADRLDTRYYNAAVHRGALAMPNFLRSGLNKR